MGYTARATFAQLADDAEVEVVELIGAVVRWNRGPIGHLAGSPLLDPRLRVIEGDVADVIAKSPRARYNAILLDVDNGPQAFTARENKRLYTPAGLMAARVALRPKGILAVWSAFEAPSFTDRLRGAGFDVEIVRVFVPGWYGGRHVLWIGRARP